MDYYDFVASAIAAVASLYNANAELAHLQKIGVKDVCVLWCGSTLQNNKAWLSTTVPDCMYYEAIYDGDKKELRLDAYRKIQSVSIPWNVAYEGFPATINIIEEMCRKNDVKVLNAAYTSGINPNDLVFRSRYFQGKDDNAHLNNAGHNLLMHWGEQFVMGL